MSLIGPDVILYCETLGFENIPGLLSNICINFTHVYILYIYSERFEGANLFDRKLSYFHRQLILSDLIWAKHKYSQRVFTRRLLQETCILSVLNIKI